MRFSKFVRSESSAEPQEVEGTADVNSAAN